MHLLLGEGVSVGDEEHRDRGHPGGHRADQRQHRPRPHGLLAEHEDAVERQVPAQGDRQADHRRGHQRVPAQPFGEEDHAHRIQQQRGERNGGVARHLDQHRILAAPEGVDLVDGEVGDRAESGAERTRRPGVDAEDL